MSVGMKLTTTRFSGLFSLPTTKGKDKTYTVDGCPVVELQGDNWEDMEVLLKAIYEPAFWDALQPTTPLSILLNPLSSLLTLSSKYILPTIRTRSVSLIKAKLPTTYEDYLTRAQRDEKYTSESIMLSIHLGRKYDVPEILPYLFYCLARLSHRRLVDSREGDVSWFFKTIALIGREKLRLAEIALSHSFLYAFRPSSQCLSSPLCSLSRGPQMEWRTIEAQKKPSPLRACGKWERLGVCERCVAFCRDEHERGRKEVWERLPGLVGVAGGWGELREGGHELVDRG
ncbi:hypothetical protein BDQ17DRAFT_1426837 [Cyathus striatus]|nr:hypothetical protein BDQ17DRAFT_1426837 [Cyathus striatus]